MPRVSYTAPATVDEAVKALAGAAGLTKVLSGGTDLLVQLKSGRVKPDLIVDMKRIPGLIGIREEGDALRDRRGDAGRDDQRQRAARTRLSRASSRGST